MYDVFLTENLAKEKTAVQKGDCLGIRIKNFDYLKCK